MQLFILNRNVEAMQVVNEHMNTLKELKKVFDTLRICAPKNLVGPYLILEKLLKSPVMNPGKSFCI
jgi:hypothetical protein